MRRKLYFNHFNCIKLCLFQLEIDAAFDDGEFDNIVKNLPLRVSQIKHRATIEVTKDGTIGAAASSIELVGLSAAIGLPKEIKINKPFLFLLQRNLLSKMVVYNNSGRVYG